MLNRRGFAPSLQCQSCGSTAQCPACDANMTSAPPASYGCTATTASTNNRCIYALPPMPKPPIKAPRPGHRTHGRAAKYTVPKHPSAPHRSRHDPQKRQLRKRCLAAGARGASHACWWAPKCWQKATTFPM